MSDTKDSDDAPLTLKAPRCLELKKTVGSGQVRQSFSRGRTKAVTVEVKKRRTILRGGAAPAEAVPFEAPEAPPAPPAEAPAETPTAEPARARVVLKSLTDDEKAARARALDGARRLDEDVRRRAEEDARRRRDEYARLAREREQADHRKAEEESRKR